MRWKIVTAIFLVLLPQTRLVYILLNYSSWLEELDADVMFLTLGGLIWGIAGIGLSLAILSVQVSKGGHFENHVGTWKPAPVKLQAVVDEVLMGYQKFAPEMPAPRVVVATRRFDAGASVVGSSKAPTLIVSLGLLRYCENNREIARGIIAHEVGHIAQQDVEQWTLVRIYTRYVLPLIVVVSMPSAIVAGIQVLGALDQANHGPPVSGSLPSYEVMWAMFAPVIAFAFYDRVKLHARESEFLADFGASIVIGCDGLLAALAVVASKSSQRLFSTHPSMQARINAINRSRIQFADLQSPLGAATHPPDAG